MTHKIVRTEEYRPVIRFADVRCDNCNVALEPVFKEDDQESWQYLFPKDALKIHLEGYYGGYFDSLGENEDPNLFFCTDCTNKLLQAFPCFAKAVGPNEFHQAFLEEFKRGKGRT